MSHHLKLPPWHPKASEARAAVKKSLPPCHHRPRCEDPQSQPVQWGASTVAEPAAAGHSEDQSSQFFAQPPEAADGVPAQPSRESFSDLPPQPSDCYSGNQQQPQEQVAWPTNSSPDQQQQQQLGKEGDPSPRADSGRVKFPIPNIPAWQAAWQVQAALEAPGSRLSTGGESPEAAHNAESTPQAQGCQTGDHGLNT